uniref:Uncharacterized protein n=1 Tax=Peronospora matthiolae TaxID=2874970 RepID=A0AAV1TNE7_9STRA
MAKEDEIKTMKLYHHLDRIESRLLAHRSGCKVDVLELQPGLSEAGKELTRRSGLDNQVTHLSGDFLELPVQHNEYDIVVDDFFLFGDKLTEEDQRTLKQDIYCPTLLRNEEITAFLMMCGFLRL